MLPLAPDGRGGASFRHFHAAPGRASVSLPGDHDRRLVAVPRSIATVFGKSAQFRHVVTWARPRGPGRCGQAAATMGCRPQALSGRPGSAAVRRAARRKKRIERKTRIFEHRYLFVRYHLDDLQRHDPGQRSPAASRNSAPLWPDGGGLSPVRPPAARRLVWPNFGDKGDCALLSDCEVLKKLFLPGLRSAGVP